MTLLLVDQTLLLSQRKIWHYTYCLLHPYQICLQTAPAWTHTDSVKNFWDSETQPRLNSPRWKMNHLLSSRGLICFWKSALNNDFFSFTEWILEVLKNLNTLFVFLLLISTVKSTLTENNSKLTPGLLFIKLKHKLNYYKLNKLLLK